MKHDLETLRRRVAELEAQLRERDVTIAKLRRARQALIDRAQRLARSEGPEPGLLQSNLLLAEQYRLRSEELARTNQRLVDEEAALRAAKEAAEESARSRTVFLSTMSHEIRTPLNGILGMASLLQDADLPAELAEYAATIGACGSALLSLVNDVLDFTRLESEAGRAEELAFRPRDMVRDVELILHERFAAAGIAFRCHVDSEVPGVVIGDLNRIRQVLLNLLANAVKFTERGQVSVSVRAAGACAAEGGGALRWEVRDTGIGIRPERLESLFQPYFQAETSTSRRYGGTGLGLAICRRIVEALGGRIGVESRVGRGSTFWFEIPLREDGAESGRGAPAVGPPSAGDAPAPDIGSAGPLRARVLVVEDEPVNRKVTAAMLRNAGCTVEVAVDGREALARLREGGFDLVFMDCQMPILDGYEATRRWREREAGGDDRLPIVALTASAMPGDMQRCAAAGMDDYLPKPVSRGQLEAKVRRWVRSPRGIPC